MEYINEIIGNSLNYVKVTFLFIYDFFEAYAEYCVEHNLIILKYISVFTIAFEKTYHFYSVFLLYSTIITTMCQIIKQMSFFWIFF